MAKKKKGLAPVNRGFATTSQPKKPAPVVEEPPEAEEPVVPESSNINNGKSTGGLNGGDPKNGGNTDGKVAAGQDDWENEFELEEGIYQGYVERLQEKGEKEINRIIKVRHVALHLPDIGSRFFGADSTRTSSGDRL
jgi:ATP-dependent RNA helicase DHX29